MHTDKGYAARFLVKEATSADRQEATRELVTFQTKFGITNAQVAAEAGVHESHIYRCAAGERVASVRLVNAWAVAIGKIQASKSSPNLTKVRAS